ncbi:MAG: ABC transporter permease [Acidobacteria bacterium]|nr:ABC transporter permease [Acidobacteriota bacterium]
MATPMPPRLWRALLQRAMPVDVRSAILRDLEEVFARIAASDGLTAAHRWYRREALSFALQFTRERFTRLPRLPRFSMLDVKLASRMVTKYPGLTLIGGLAIATAIAVTVVAFEITHDLSNPSLPLPDGDRIVTLQLSDPRSGFLETRLTFDVEQWRRASSIDSIGAYDTVERTLVGADGRGELVRAAEMSAAGFRVAGVAPLYGRTLTDDDEREGAAPVAVIGHSVWVTRYGSDPGVIGQSMRLGSTTRTIVGVMPEGFGFPVAHSIWIPLPPLRAPERFSGPGLRAFAKLSPSATMAAAEAELSVITNQQPVPAAMTAGPPVLRVLPYAGGLIPSGYIRQAYVLQSVLMLLLVICCSNVATLVFARTVTRQNEILVRTALGASRGRILGQFFVEALVLASLGAAVGLLVANGSIQWTMRLIWESGSPRPFWWDDRIAPVTYLYAGGLTLFVAALCGIVPALKSTRGSVHAGMQTAATRGASASFGFGWTSVIVVQVALCVALLPAALSQAWDAVKAQAGGTGFASHEYLSAVLDVDDATVSAAERATRRAVMYRDLAARVMREPGVRGVAFAERFPGMDHLRGPIEVDGVMSPDRVRPQSYTALVAPEFFRELDVRPIAGRVFQDADVTAGRQVAVVNRLFVEKVLGGRNAVGRRVRFASNGTPRPWLEIIGVVPDLGMSPLRPDEGIGLYRVAAPGAMGVDRLAIHVSGDPDAFTPRLRALALDVSPSLQLRAPVALNLVSRADQVAFRAFAAALFIVGAIGILLSTAGIYAMMSFTVSRRTREIAIRAALGANPRRLVGAIFSRAARQIGAGALAGIAMVIAARPSTAREIWLPLGLALFMLIIGLFACAAPARRALKIEPSDALKEL